MTPHGIERLKKEEAAARKAAATFSRLAGQYREWGDAQSLAEATRLENLASWHVARAELWRTAA